MQIKRFFLGLCVFFLMFVINISAHAESKPARLPIIIDTDASPDDAIAILYLLNDPKFVIKAIMVDRNAGSHPTTAIAHIAYVLQLAHAANIPIYPGLNKQPATSPAYSEEILNSIDDAYYDTKLTAKVTINQAELAQLIINEPQPIEVLSLGSLTNIDDLFRQYPQVKSHLQSLIIMGGAVYVPGNIKAVLPQTNNISAELNIFVDPEAFNRVLASSIPIILVSLDITNKVPVTIAFLEQLKLINTPRAKFIYHLLLANLPLIQTNNYEFWDPLAAFVMAHPEEISTKKVKISTIIQPGDHYGQLIANSKGYPIDLVTKVNQQALETAILQSLSVSS